MADKSRDILEQSINTWVSQAYVNGNLDTHVSEEMEQGSETCEALILDAVDKYEQDLLSDLEAMAVEFDGESTPEGVRVVNAIPLEAIRKYFK